MVSGVSIEQIFRLTSKAEASRTEPIKLLEVNENTVSSGVMPLHFGTRQVIAEAEKNAQETSGRLCYRGVSYRKDRLEVGAGRPGCRCRIYLSNTPKD